MHITYDPEVDALYIRFKETTVTTKNLTEGIAADYDTAGKLAGIEILDAMKRFGDKDTLKKITLEKISLSAQFMFRESQTTYIYHFPRFLISVNSSLSEPMPTPSNKISLSLFPKTVGALEDKLSKISSFIN